MGLKKYVSKFKNYAEAEGILPQLIFNCDEIGLFRKKMPKRQFITLFEKALLGLKSMKYSLNFCVVILKEEYKVNNVAGKEESKAQGTYFK